MFKKEIWKDIVGFEGLYQISNYGNIKSFVKNNKGKPMKQRILRNYMSIGLTKNKKQYTFFVHRLVAETFIPNPNNFPCVNHIDGDKLNNSINNLEWVTYSENSKHSIYILDNKKPPKHKGENNHFSKHNEKEIEELRKKRKMGYTLKQLANEYNYTIGHICNICNYKSWK